VTSDPWTATRKDDGRIYGRGAADDKGGLVVQLGTLRLFDGKPPCRLKLILEGMEETDSNLEAFVRPTRSCSPATCSSSATWATSASASPP
jgi:acetylornithine deacetylase/succinyl-diaminopimelate desuccinylase-like protein